MHVQQMSSAGAATMKVVSQDNSNSSKMVEVAAFIY
jgi:hypothetical protein